MSNILSSATDQPPAKRPARTPWWRVLIAYAAGAVMFEFALAVSLVVTRLLAHSVLATIPAGLVGWLLHGILVGSALYVAIGAFTGNAWRRKSFRFYMAAMMAAVTGMETFRNVLRDRHVDLWVGGNAWAPFALCALILIPIFLKYRSMHASELAEERAASSP